MNAQNAQSIGYNDGKTYLRNAVLQDWQPSHQWKNTLLGDAHNRAFYSYGVKSLKTIDKYVQGWEEAIDAFKAEKAKEQEEAARRAAIQHNSNTRFCCCAECSK